MATADALDLGLVVFDITGTVITNTEAVADAFLSALRVNGVQITEEELHRWSGEHYAAGSQADTLVQSGDLMPSPRTPLADSLPFSGDSLRMLP